MTIRPITGQDIRSCASIFMAAYNRMPWNYRWDADKAVAYLYEYFLAPGFIGIIANDGEHVVGAMFGHRKTWWTGNQLFIDELFVDPALQGKGYGKELIAWSEEYCKKNKLEMITLMTNKLMPAYEFYYSNNFVKVEQYVFLFKQIE